MRAIVLIVVLVGVCIALDNGLGLTPPMGWNNFNAYDDETNETAIRQGTDLMESFGLLKLGYEYVNIDDCWAGWTRNTDQTLTTNLDRFPSGIPALIDYVHAKGFKFGLYSDSGNKTCKGYPGSFGYEDVDAKTFASWGVDYLKYDNCGTKYLPFAYIREQRMRDALNATGRPIFFNIIAWIAAPWGTSVANSWRTFFDVKNNWEKVIEVALYNSQWHMMAGPGHWNDPDMLEVGVGGLTHDEEISHFSIWSISKSPLIIGCDLALVSNESLAIMMNKEVIAVNQDKLGVQAPIVHMDFQWVIWAGPLADGSKAVLILNLKKTAAKGTVTWQQVGFKADQQENVRD